MPLLTEPFTIGTAGKADEAAVVALWRDCGLVVPWNDPHADYRLALGRENSDILVAKISDRIVGSLMVGHDGHRGWIYYVSTALECRQQGIAKRLIETAETWLSAKGIPKLQLLVRASNAGVISFYERLGFTALTVTTLQKVLGQERTIE